ARCAVLELAREQRPAALELPQYVAPERSVGGHELPRPAFVGVPRRTPPAPHQRSEEREVLDRADASGPLEQRALVPEEPVELRTVVRAEPVPENEMLRLGNGRDRGEPEEGERAGALEVARRA